MIPDNTIPIFAAVESLDAGLCRAKLLSPLSLEVVANNWPQAKRLLMSQLRKHIRKIAPKRWAGTRPTEMPVHRSVPIVLKPLSDDYCWTEPIQVSVDLFSWNIAGTTSHWSCPSLDSVIVTSSAEVDDALLEAQIRNMIARKFDKLELRDVMTLFGNRQFTIEELTHLSPRDLSDMYVSEKKGSQKSKIETIRRVATRVVTWKHAPVFEQQENVAKLDELLAQTEPQSVLLVGPQGVGKTAIVYQWAQSYADRIWATSGARLVSGMTGLGMWQQRCLQVIREAFDAKLILHLGSLVELIESGRINGQPGVASLLRSAIDRSRLVAIAECTPEQLSYVQREDPLLLRCFTKLEIQPTNEQMTSRILEQMGQHLSKSSIESTSPAGISMEPVSNLFQPKAIQELALLHQRFSTYSAMPGQPIHFMRGMFEEWPVGTPISEIDIAQRFSRDTGLPMFLLDDSIALDLDEVRNRLTKSVMGQPEPIESIVRLVATLKARLNRVDRPLASLLLIGPTGIGKTETAKALARLLYRDQSRMIRIDMSEYAQPWSAIRLIGSDCEGDGTLTSPIRDQPFSVVLLDEFEKCHPSVLDLLLQVLGEGRLTDSTGRIADFRNAIIILTSNLGVDSFHGRSFGFGSSETEVYEHFLKAVRTHVRPELLGRIDQIIPFRPLPLNVVRQIADRELEAISNRYGIRYHPIQWGVDESAREWIATAGYDPAFGARPLRRTIEREVVIPLADCMSESTDLAKQKAIVKFTTSNVSPGSPTSPKQILVQTERSIATGSNRNQESEDQHVKNFVDLVRDLRYRADRLVQSQQFHALENKVERLQRLMRQSLKQMRKIVSTSRLKGHRHRLKLLRRDIGMAESEVEQLLSVVEQARQLHRKISAQWNAGELSRSNELDENATLLSQLLRQELIQLQGQVDAKREMQTVILLCNPIESARPLWEAYLRLAKMNHWRLLPFRLVAYNPLADQDSVQFQQRQQATRQRLTIPADKQPSFRLLSTKESIETEPTEPAVKQKEIDVFRIIALSELDSLDANTLGIAFQLDLGSISSWLGEEHGVHHFLVPTKEGTKRHRARMLLHPGRLIDWEPQCGWSETPSLSTRDPRRTYHAVDRRLTSHLFEHEIGLSESDPVGDLIEMIQYEGDTQLWQSIGYVAIPLSATLQAPLYFMDEMPF